MQNIVFNTDCLAYMKTLPDKAFDLAIVDPPYGDAIENESNDLRFHAGQRYDRYKDIYDNNDSEKKVERTGGTWAAKYGKKIAAWDVAPPQEYFNELFRVSKNQIIWGGNYFDLPPIRDRLDDKEKVTFNNIVMLWMASSQNVAAATVMFTVLNRYLIPLAEKLTCLERSIELIKSTSLGEINEDNL